MLNRGRAALHSVHHSAFIIQHSPSMPEAFLILFAGGIILAAAVSDPRDVTLNWLRLCGILSLAMIGLSAFFLFRREAAPDGAAGATTAVFPGVAATFMANAFVAVLL